jgi:predicted O-methyltransferase YrrM
MTQPQWTAVDKYLADLFAQHDPALDAALADSQAAGLPAIQVAAVQGKLLHVLALLSGARKVLEVGTLGGYSTIWLARALQPGGRLVSLEISPAHADVARKNLARAGVADRVEVRVGPALEALPKIAGEGIAPFDLVFIDADKQNNAAYFDWAVRLGRRGTLIITDNVVRDGAVIDAESTDERVQGVRRFHAAVAADPRVTASAIQTVGQKGYDGLSFAVVTADPAA